MVLNTECPVQSKALSKSFRLSAIVLLVQYCDFRTHYCSNLHIGFMISLQQHDTTWGAVCMWNKRANANHFSRSYTYCSMSFQLFFLWIAVLIHLGSTDLNGICCITWSQRIFHISMMSCNDFTLGDIVSTWWLHCKFSHSRAIFLNVPAHYISFHIELLYRHGHRQKS